MQTVQSTTKALQGGNKMIWRSGTNICFRLLIVKHDGAYQSVNSEKSMCVGIKWNLIQLTKHILKALTYFDKTREKRVCFGDMKEHNNKVCIMYIIKGSGLEGKTTTAGRFRVTGRR